MANHMSTHRVPALLDALDRDGHIEDRPVVEAFVLERQGETELPLQFRVLIGVGAAIAAACFIVFLHEIDLIDFNDTPGMLPTGLVFIATAIGLNRLSGTAQTIANSFLLQASFAAMATGKFLFVIGFDGILDTYWAGSLATLLVTAAMYHVYRMSIDRFLSSLMVLLSVLVTIVWGDETTLPREPLVIGFFALQLAGAAVLLTHGRIRRDYVPLAYAFAFSLCATVLYPAAYEATGGRLYGVTIHPFPVNALMAGGLIALFAWAAGSIDALQRPPLILASLGAVLLGMVSAPGVMLSIGLMILGYAKHDKLLLVLGALLMPAFLWLYYYSLDVSLLTKSLILTGSGVILLAGHFYLAHTVQNSEA